MTITPKRLISGDSQLGTVLADIYTVPRRTTTVIKQMTAYNSSATTHTASIYIGVGKLIEQSIPASKTLIISEAVNHVLGEGESIKAVASAAGAITLMVSGLEVS